MTHFRPSEHAAAKVLDTGFADTEASRGHAAAGDRSIGDIISQANNLSPDQIEQILAYQREKGVRFGEAAVALGLASSDDVLWALAQQFHYPYSPDSVQGFHPDLVVANKPFTDQAEAFRTMRSHLIMKMYSEPDRPRQALAVLSPDSGDGKSYFAAMNKVSAGSGPVTFAPLALAFSMAGPITVISSVPKSPPSPACGFNAATAMRGDDIPLARSAW